MAIDRGLNNTVSTNPLGIDNDDYVATVVGPKGDKGDAGDITAEYVAMYNDTIAAKNTAVSSSTTATTKASEASTSASNAATSETNASTSETNAATSATNAATSETNASTSETNASTSETNASASASSASTSASTATTKATEAATSATNAAASEVAAETAETNAETAETNAATSATTATTKASEASTSATNAATSATNAAASLASFTGQYVSQATAPSSPDTGDLWFDETSSTMKVYNGTGWANAGSSINGTEESVQYTATAGQTTFAATYDAGYVQVYLNGIRLDTSDYTATNGTSIVLDVGAAVDDSVFIQSFGTFALADHYTKAASDARYAQTVNHYTKTEADGLLDAKVDDSQVLTNVPSGAVFTDTIYTKPNAEPISYITNLQTSLDAKVDDSQVLTNVPANAVFTDTVYTHPTGDGNLHVPATSTNNDGKILTAGSTAGDISWQDAPVSLPDQTGNSGKILSTDGSVASWIDNAGSDVSKITYEYTATAGQTTFSGADDNGLTLAYTAGNILLTYGGLDLPFSDYTATNGTSVVLADGAVAGEIIRIIAFETFDVANTYTRAQADAAFLPINALTDPSFFRAHLNTNQSVSSSSYTKINFETVDVDTDNAYSTSTYTWTPTVEGWYQVTTNLNGYASSLSRLIIVFRKNGDSIRVGDVDPSSATGDWTINGSSLVYMNGTTDSMYVDGYIIGSSATFRGAVHGTGGVSDTFFQAFLVKEGS